jgi:hypothetical protein
MDKRDGGGGDEEQVEETETESVASTVKYKMKNEILESRTPSTFLERSRCFSGCKEHRIGGAMMARKKVSSILCEGFFHYDKTNPNARGRSRI